MLGPRHVRHRPGGERAGRGNVQWLVVVGRGIASGSGGRGGGVGTVERYDTLPRYVWERQRQGADPVSGHRGGGDGAPLGR